MAPSGDRAEVGGLRVTPEPMEDALVLRLEGELDLAGAPRLTAAVDSWPESPAAGRPLVLDLSGVSFMDSTGVRTLVDAARTAREGDLAMALLRPSPAVTRVLDLVDLRRAFVEIDDLGADALARVGARRQG